MTGSALQLRSISDLLGERFFVPDYQRGYRWTPRQVQALLDDLEAFFRAGNGKTDYYCLQPIVVRERGDGSWELVDGQQRLTTLLLILRAQRDMLAILRKPTFSIEYQTRKGSGTYLESPTAELAQTNIDFHHIHASFETIRQWFAERDGSFGLEFIGGLTRPDGQGPNVRVIWYALDQDEKPVDTFVRLNVGRIPLTSAELIRAVLLRTDRAERSQGDRDLLHIAHEWDRIEKRLREDSYWFFLQTGKIAPPARIEYLFDLFVRQREQASADEIAEDPLATFFAFVRIAEGKKVWAIWSEFEELAQILEEWFEDRTLFHLVGFLVATATVRQGASAPEVRQAGAKVLVELLRAREGMTAAAFDRKLRTLAWERLAARKGASVGADVDVAVAELLESTSYGSDSELVPRTLLLFNLAGLLEATESNQRFQFDAYKNNHWDIEHVRSVAEESPRSPAARKRWLFHAREFVASPIGQHLASKDGPSLVKDIDEQLAATSPDDEVFGRIFAAVRVSTGEAEARENDHALSNLVLLDMGTNRSYKNAIFPVKRQRIIDLDRMGQFVPPATRNVFLKYYAPNAAQLMLWAADDQRAYGEEILRTLRAFFAPLQGEPK